ncbi:MAG: 50S ribosomal protein L6 [Thermodesulfobacteriota bacterium]
MSRIGRKSIKLPDKVNVESKNNVIHVKGPKGELSVSLPDGIITNIDDGTVEVTRKNEDKQTRAFHGLTRSLLLNSIVGVSEGFTKTLEIVGTGYKAEAAGSDGLKLTLGYSHSIDFKLPKGVEAKIEERGTLLTLEGIDKQIVGETAAKIRKLRKPDAYKGKGVRYKGEELRLKPGKAGAKK